MGELIAMTLREAPHYWRSESSVEKFKASNLKLVIYAPRAMHLISPHVATLK